LGVLLALSVGGTGCQSTAVGRALFGADGSGPSSNRLVAFLRTGKMPPAGVPDSPGTAGQEPVVWRAVQHPGGPAEGTAAPSNVQLASAQPGGGSQRATPVAWHSREVPVAFAAPEKESNEPKEPKDAETLPSPRPLPAPEVALVPGVPPPGVPGPHGGPVPRELNKMAFPTYTVEPPDILLIEAPALPTQKIQGQHLVRPDGTVGLGIYGSIYVTGMTLEQIRLAVAQAVASRMSAEYLAKNPVNKIAENVNVDVLAYNSRFYYVITDGGGYGEQVVRVPSTGNETVLDAIAQIYGLPAVASKKHIWVARRTPGHGPDEILPVDWCGITRRGEAVTNYQIFPGDRVYVKADRLITIDTAIAKVLSPIERLLGVTLLGSETVNSIRNRGTGTTTP
jgi:polysaccharide export outer membrane protein